MKSKPLEGFRRLSLVAAILFPAAMLIKNVANANAPTQWNEWLAYPIFAVFAWGAVRIIGWVVAGFIADRVNKSD